MFNTKYYRYTYIDDRCIRDYSEKDVLQVANEICEQRAERVSESLSSPAKVREYLVANFSASECTKVMVLGLDNRHRIKGVRQIYQGLPVDMTLSTQALISDVLSLCCAAAIVVRVVSTREQDAGRADALTDNDRQCASHWSRKLAILDIRLLDVIVLSNKRSISGAEQGIF